MNITVEDFFVIWIFISGVISVYYVRVCYQGTDEKISRFLAAVTASVGSGSAQRHLKWTPTFHCVRNERGYCSEPEYWYDTPQTAAN